MIQKKKQPSFEKYRQHYRFGDEFGVNELNKILP
ncbi:MAG: hypothetical protein S4CHLAM7_04290 [Chlamydiae bacterium]|nr:hypothetical protein [Chlamydiota bacterium]